MKIATSAVPPTSAVLIVKYRDPQSFIHGSTKIPPWIEQIARKGSTILDPLVPKSLVVFRKVHKFSSPKTERHKVKPWMVQHDDKDASVILNKCHPPHCHVVYLSLVSCCWCPFYQYMWIQALDIQYHVENDLVPFAQLIIIILGKVNIYLILKKFLNRYATMTIMFFSSW